MNKENLIKEIESYKSNFETLWNTLERDKYSGDFTGDIYIETLKKDIKDIFMKFHMEVYSFDKTHPLIPYIQSIPLENIKPKKDIFDKEYAEKAIELMNLFLWYLNH